MKTVFFTLMFWLLIGLPSLCSQEHSVARKWNEQALFGNQRNLQRATVNTRNLWHLSAVMYDAWSVYEESSPTYFLGNNIGEFSIPFSQIEIPNIETERLAAQEEAISCAAYRLLKHRFNNLPGNNEVEVSAELDNLMLELGYDINYTSTDYVSEGAAALGNYIGEQVIAFGLQDGSNESEGYDELFYETINPIFFEPFGGNTTIIDPNRWQPVVLETWIDQNPFGSPPTTVFSTPEWGNVNTFSLSDDQLSIYFRDENFYNVYLEAESPYLIDEENPETGLMDLYKRDYAMLIAYSALLDSEDNVIIDASPAVSGNNTEFENYEQFYDFFNGTDASQGYELNPKTELPYLPQPILRGDYMRVAANYWFYKSTADAKWFTILNGLSDHADFEKRWLGEGDMLSDLEWDIKSYFVLGGVLHDCAIAAYSNKAWFDYIRPFSSIRYMAAQGQSTDSLLPNYSNSGLPLIPDLIELIDEQDPLVGENLEHLNKLKVKSWLAHDELDQFNFLSFGQIIDGVQDSTVAGVGWMLAEKWRPYNRKWLGTAPNAAHVSEVSALSASAAAVLETITGDPFFPGGIYSVEAQQDNFLSVEVGPSETIELQWATYKDAADQAGISRLYSGDQTAHGDMEGRKLGRRVSEIAIDLSLGILGYLPVSVLEVHSSIDIISDQNVGETLTISVSFDDSCNTAVHPELDFSSDLESSLGLVNSTWVSDSLYQWSYIVFDAGITENLSGTISNAESALGVEIESYLFEDLLAIDTENPSVIEASISYSVISDSESGSELVIDIEYDEPMNQEEFPLMLFSPDQPTSLTLSSQEWISDTYYRVIFNITDEEEETEVTFSFNQVTDLAGNEMISYNHDQNLVVDNKNPTASVYANTYSITQENEGDNGF